MNVTFFERRAFEGVIKDLMIRAGPNSNDRCPYKERKRHYTGRRPFGDRGRDRGDASRSQGMLGGQQHPRGWERGWAASPSQPQLREEPALPTPGLDSWPPEPGGSGDEISGSGALVALWWSAAPCPPLLETAVSWKVGHRCLLCLQAPRGGAQEGWGLTRCPAEGVPPRPASATSPRKAPTPPQQRLRAHPWASQSEPFSSSLILQGRPSVFVPVTG